MAIMPSYGYAIVEYIYYWLVWHKLSGDIYVSVCHHKDDVKILYI